MKKFCSSNCSYAASPGCCSIGIEPSEERCQFHNPVRRNKYGAVRTWSAVCERMFDSKAEAYRGETLQFWYDSRGSNMTDLDFQVPFSLAPKKKITIDFSYVVNGRRIYEDVKGRMTRDFKTKLLWLEQKHGVTVKIVDKYGEEVK